MKPDTKRRLKNIINQWNIPLSTSHRVWYKRAQANGVEIGLAMDATVVPYQN